MFITIVNTLGKLSIYVCYLVNIDILGYVIATVFYYLFIYSLIKYINKNYKLFKYNETHLA